ncbi:MAG: hypothetical protein WAM66_03170 [Acidobacteriaceae bacterium]
MLKRSLILLLIPLSFLFAAPVAKADLPYSSNNAKNAGVIIGGLAVVAGIGFLIYYSVHHGRSLKGCITSGPDGLQLVNEGDQRSYNLSGRTATIQPGDRVRVKGKKIKNAPTHRQFAVAKVSKDYGACRVSPAAP